MKFSPSLKLKLSILVLLVAIFLGPTVCMATGPSTVVIDEFRTRLGDDIKDEYIVVANYGSTTASLNGYTLKKKTASADSKPGLIYSFDDFELKPFEKVMISYSEYNGSETLADVNNIIILYDNSTNIVDCVAYGTVNFAFIEGTALLNPAKGVPYKRVNNPEINDNSHDFEQYLPSLPIDVNADKLVISELLPSPDEGSEWFELYNPTNLDISLANLKICDALGSRHCYFFDGSDIISAGKYKTYTQTVTKITLNNTGDWLELYDTADNILTDSGGNFGSADKGISLALFGSDYRWTATLTPDAQNIFTDIVEVEGESTPKPKISKSKITAKKKTIATASSDNDTDVEDIEQEGEVKGAETENNVGTDQKALFNRKTVGWGLIGLAILLVVSYTLWYFRDYAKNFYHKIIRRDDSARF